MKLHLPKGILLGLMAAVSVSAAEEEATHPFYQVIDDAVKVSTDTAWNDAGIEDGAKFIAKDGEGKLTYTGNGTISSTIYAREGELQIGDGSTATEVSISAQSTATARNSGLNVGGKDAVVRINKATVSNGATGNMVGGLSGNGKLIVENGSNLNLGGSEVFIIGDAGTSTGAWDGSTSVFYTNLSTAQEDVTVTTADSTAADYLDKLDYQGNYSAAQNGADIKFGRGDVTVSGGSTMSTGRSFWMGEGSLTVDGNASKVTIGNSSSGYRTLMGYVANSTSEINITNGAQLEFQTSGFDTNLESNTNTVIKVDGVGSELKVGTAQTARFGNEATQNASTSLEITGGATANFETQYVKFGSEDAGNKTVKVDVHIGEESSLTAAGYVYLREGATIENAGTLTVKEHSYIWAKGTAAIINSGTINSFVRMEDNCSLTALDGSTMGGAINAYRGTAVSIQGQVTLNGELWMQGGSTLIFTLDGSIDMNGNQVYGGVFGTENFILDASSDSSITDLASLTISQELFTNYSEDSTINDDTLVTVKFANGTTATTTLGALTVAVPEPSTATLSLLALAALAARRRRR